MAAPAAPGKLPEVGQCSPPEADLCKMPLPGDRRPPGVGLGKQSVLAAARRQRTEHPINDCKGTGIWERREARRVVQPIPAISVARSIAVSVTAVGTVTIVI